MFRSSRHPSRLVPAWIAVGLAIIGAVLAWAALARPSIPDTTVATAPNGHSTPPTSAPAPEASPERPGPRADKSDVRDRITGLVLPESHPVSVSIPKLGVRSRLIDLGLKSDGEMEVPKDPADAGWFSAGPTPGALGPAVIAGHVRWNGAPGVFHRLGNMRRGDRVTVTREDGKTAVFTVSRVERYPKSRFPSRAVYGAIDHAGLRLITCGGTYDAASNRYLDNVIVFAKLKAVHGP
jgi:sortase (surface protein transpeptidase)